MFYPTEKEFVRLAKKGNVIPVYKEISADTDTPVSAFFKACRGEYAFLLESVEGSEKVGRYSFLGMNPALIFKSKGKNIEIIRNLENDTRVEKFATKEDPLNEIKKIMQQFRLVKAEGLPRFCGGLVGYMGYDLVRFFEKLPAQKKDDLHFPDCYFILADSLIIFDHFQHKISIVFNAFIPKKCDLKRIYAQAMLNVNKLESDLRSFHTFGDLEDIPKKKSAISSNFSKNGFKRAVEKIKRYIKNGEIIQAVLSQRFQVETQTDPFDAYRNLRSINPSPYMYYLKFGDLNVIGSSPEMLVRCEDGLVETRPIAGTRPRGKDDKEDAKLEQDLLADAKEKAEHLMLVDLGRNDLGRVCSYKSVQIKDFMTIELYSHVMHIVSSVVGRLKKGRDIFDLLRACFPAGTVSGAPKVRAMQIIDELEPVLRGPYAGCVGYFSFSGNLDTCITIRTIVMKGNRAYVQAGAGIVADSQPEREFQETRNKAQACFKALSLRI
jgi:anthranilate synthase component 1